MRPVSMCRLLSLVCSFLRLKSYKVTHVNEHDSMHDSFITTWFLISRSMLLQAKFFKGLFDMNLCWKSDDFLLWYQVT